MPEVLVVGVDGSDNGWAALAWAADEARLRGATLRIVCAFEDPAATAGLGTAFGAGAPVAVDPTLIEGAAQDIVNEAHQICPYSRATRGNIDVTIILASQNASGAA